MIVLATGFITRPDALEPHLDHEMRVMRELKAEGVVKSRIPALRRARVLLHPRRTQHRLRPRTDRRHPTVRHREPRDARIRRDLRNLNPDRATAASPAR